MDDGLRIGGRGALDEFEGYQTNKANLIIILRQSYGYKLNFELVLRWLLPSPFYTWLGLRVLVGCDTILDYVGLQYNLPSLNTSSIGSFLGHNLRGLYPNMN
jgi:hypothetical protein